MPLKSRINLRLSPEQKYIYEKKAVRLGLPLAEYVRQKLEIDDNRVESLESSSIMDNADKAMMLEMLLLLRQLVQPRQIQLAQGELKRLGLKPWTSSDTQGQL